MGKTRKRSSMTAEEIAQKNPYSAILFLILRADAKRKKIKFIHLRYALCENHCIPKNKIKEIQVFFDNKNDDDISMMLRRGLLKEKIGGKNRQGDRSLSNFLFNLQKKPDLDLITKIPDPDDEKNPYYRLTRKGIELVQRSLLRAEIERLPPDKLSQLNLVIARFLSR